MSRASKMKETAIQNNETHCSVVITAHAEGNLLHQTLRSAVKSADYAARNGKVKCEIIVVKDCVIDETTRSVVHFWENNAMIPIRSYDVGFGALSLSRNFGIGKSLGTYVSILDGDDLYSENWIQKAFYVLERNIADVVHPEKIVGFPYDPYIKKLSARYESQYLLFETNQWPALLMARKEIFIKIPYVKDTGQFAYQDWLWNCQTLESGYRHICVEGTLMLIRQKEPGKSLWQKSFSMNRVVRPNLLFRRLIMEKNTITERRKSRSTFFDDVLSMFFNWLTASQPGIYEFLKKFKRAKFRKSVNDFEPVVREQISDLEKIEPLLATIHNYRTINDFPGKYLLSHIPESLAKLPGHETVDIFLIGTPKDMECVPSTLLRNFSDEKDRYYIFDQQCRNAGLDRCIGADQRMINLSDIHINKEKMSYMVLRVLLESPIKVIYIKNSVFAPELLLKYMNVLSFKTLVLELECPPLKLSGAFKMVVEIAKLLLVHNAFTKIIVDNDDFKAFLEKVYGIPESKIYLREHQVDNSPG